MTFSVLPKLNGLLKLMLSLFCRNNIQGRELCWHDFYAICTFNIIMCQDTCEPVCFKLGVMLDTTQLYSLIPVWVTFML